MTLALSTFAHGPPRAGPRQPQHTTTNPLPKCAVQRHRSDQRALPKVDRDPSQWSRPTPRAFWPSRTCLRALEGGDEKVEARFFDPSGVQIASKRALWASVAL